MNPVLSASLLAGALASDNRSSLRLMVSQPVCGGLLAGFVLGNPREGLLAGAVLQMLFLGMIPVRGIGMSDLALGGVAVSSLHILALRSAAVDPAAKGLVLLLSLAASLGVAAAGRSVYRFWESRSHVFADAALRLAGRGRFALASALQQNQQNSSRRKAPSGRKRWGRSRTSENGSTTWAARKAARWGR